MAESAAATACRVRCNACGGGFDRRTMRLVPVPCNVRKFAHEVFHVWRCRTCRCLHCWEVVDLDYYYAAYETQRQELDFFMRLAYREQLRRFRAAGLKRHHRLLDYGCGGAKLVAYLHTRGYENAVGYDPYGAAEGLADASVLETGAFDFICLQEVIEHVEEPRLLIAELSKLLRAGGALLVGMPNGDDIDLNRICKYKHHLHVPYHLHIYTRDVLIRMAHESELEPIASYRRFYMESLFFGMNEAFFRSYAEHVDGTVDALLEQVRVGTILCSPELLFHGSFGYLYSGGRSITVVFRKRS